MRKWVHASVAFAERPARRWESMRAFRADAAVFLTESALFIFASMSVRNWVPE